MKKKSLPAGRRNFLKVLGAGFTGSMLSPVVSNASKLKIGKRKARIGLLLPESAEHLEYPKAFLNGINMGLNQHNAIKKGKIELITEQVHFGAPMISKEKTTKLINENDVDLMVGLLNTEVASHICSTIQNSKTPFILANAGENYPGSEIRNNPCIFLNHLGLYQSNYRLGEMMVKEVGKRAIIVTSFYDSGYDALFTFRQGVEKAGGEIVDTFIEQGNQDNFKEQTIDKIKSVEPDFIFVLMNGRSASDFLNLCGLSGVRTQIAVSNFVLEENRLHELGNINSTLYSVTAWNNALQTRKNIEFNKEFEKQYRFKPNSFAVLGYETGLQIYMALSGLTPEFNGSDFIHSFASVTLDSPRGKLSYDKSTGVLRTPLYALECNKKIGAYELKTSIIKEIDSIESSHNDFTILDTNLRSGWFNPYLFV